MMQLAQLVEVNWKPLERLFSAEECSHFMYVGPSGDIELYKHRETRHYLNVHCGERRVLSVQQRLISKGQQSGGTGLRLWLNTTRRNASRVEISQQSHFAWEYGEGR